MKEQVHSLKEERSLGLLYECMSIWSSQYASLQLLGVQITSHRGVHRPESHFRTGIAFRGIEVK
jgi:hypothetical protein